MFNRVLLRARKKHFIGKDYFYVIILILSINTFCIYNSCLFLISHPRSFISGLAIAHFVLFKIKNYIKICFYSRTIAIMNNMISKTAE